MENRFKMQLKRQRKFVILASAVLVPLILLSVFLVWRAQASDQHIPQRDSLSRFKLSTQETINIEFFYSGDDFADAYSGAADFADLLSQETGLTIQASVQRCEADVVEHLGTGQADLAKQINLRVDNICLMST